MSNRAWVTLATNDSYGLGALVLAHSLRRVNSAYPSAILITPSVTEPMRDRLRAVFAEVVLVDVLDSRDATHLALLQRPELGITFTKIHCWGLTQYEKCVFLDADALIVQNCDELFEREELSAAPDVGWPDCFNSGVFVYKPSAETFDKLVKLAQERGSFDGGDQGLLNSFFSDWAHGDINKHLPFLYNVTSAAFYSYLPALKHYGQDLKIIHFIGAAKPWLQQYNFQSRSVDAPSHLKEFLQLWWDLFVADVHSQLDESMVEEEEVSHRLPALPPHDVCQHYEPQVDADSEFPWHHPSAQIQEQTHVPKVDFAEFHDPWDIYKGHIPPKENASEYNELQRVEDQEEIRKYAWDYKLDHGNQSNAEFYSNKTYDAREDTSQYQGRYEYGGQQWDQNDQSQHQQQTNHWLQEHHHHDHSHSSHEHKHDSFDHGNTHFHNYHYDHSTHEYHNHDNYSHDHSSHHQNVHSSSHYQYFEESHSNFDHFHKHKEDTQQSHLATYNSSEHIHAQHVQTEKIEPRTQRRRRLRRIDIPLRVNGAINGGADSEDSDIYDDIIPRHPYDGFYLRHRATIDARGRKVCSHEIPPTPSPSPPPSLVSESPILDDILPEENGHDYEDDLQSGVAGNLARVVAGVGAPREALDELSRRQGWEAGNIDYMGADSFDNILAKISQTLNQTRISPPKQPSPPKEPAPKAPSPPKEPAPKAPSPPKEPAPKAPSPPKEPAPKAPSPPKEPAPKEPSPLKEPAPKAPSPPKEPAPKAPSPPKEQPAPAPTPVPAPAAAPTPVEVAQEAVATEVQAPPPADVEPPATPVVPEVPISVEKAPPTAAPVSDVPVTAQIPVAAQAPKAEAKAEVPTAVEKPLAKTPSAEIPTTVETPAGTKASAGTPAVQELKKTEAPVVPPTPPATPKSSPEATTPESAPEVSQVPVTVEAPKAAPAAETAKPDATPEKSDAPAATDSPPLANTPSKEEAPSLPAAKSEERRKPAGKLQLVPPGAGQPLPTPDSELEDAADLAHAIIASELEPRPTPANLTVADPEVSTPPVGAVSLAQIGVKSKAKSTIASQIESSVTEKEPESPTTPTDAPKKKVIKKVKSKEGASGDAPVPPPRKKEKKPKEK